MVDRPATDADVRAVAAAMRPADVAECALHGLTPLEALAYSCAATGTARALTVDGVPVACYGAAVADDGTLAPWLLATPGIEQVPRTVARRARRVVAAWRRQGPMRNVCDTANTLAVAFLRWLGFRVHVRPGVRLAVFTMEA